MVNAIPWEVLMPSTKYEGFSYPIHFLKSRDSVIRNNFLEYRTNKATLFAWRNDLYALLVTNKAKHIPNMLVSCSCSETIYNKSTPTHVERILHVHAKSFFDKNKRSSSRWILFSKNVLFDRILSTHCGVILPCYELSKWPSYVAFVTEGHMVEQFYIS